MRVESPLCAPRLRDMIAGPGRSMSKAFTKEPDGDNDDERDLADDAATPAGVM